MGVRGVRCRRRYGVLVLALGLGALGCDVDRSRPTVPVFGDLAVSSDPSGALIAIDGRSLGTTTPDTVADVAAGRHLLQLALDVGDGGIFRWRDSVTVPEENLASVEAALEGGCAVDCPFSLERGRIVCRFNTQGDTCASVFFSTEPALRFPGPSGGDYGAGGRLTVAAILGADAGGRAGDTVSTLVFDPSWIGRRPVGRLNEGRRSEAHLEYWATARFAGSSLLGLAVQQTLVAVDSSTVEDVLFLRFRLRNVSADPRYRALYPGVSEGGHTFTSLYLGFGLDADVGTADDDRGTVDQDLGLPFLFDADFADPEIGDGPALVGTVTAEPPAGATERILTFWRAEDDWDNGTRHDFAWRLLAGRLGGTDPIADHPAPGLGFIGTASADYRFIESHGPLRLGPGDEVEFTVALLLAPPVPGTFDPGTPVAPGDPLSADRGILTIAGQLRELAARVPELWERHRAR